MTQPQQVELKTYIAHLSAYYQKPITDIVLKMYVEDLIDLDFAKVMSGYEQYRRNPKNRTMPLPAQIRAIVSPEADPEAEARLLVDDIRKAISDHGWADGESARLAVGPIGWQIVQGMGGWMRVCESDIMFNHGLLAQMRNRAQDILSYQPRNEFGLIDNTKKRHINFSSNDLLAEIGLTEKEQS